MISLAILVELVQKMVGFGKGLEEYAVGGGCDDGGDRELEDWVGLLRSACICYIRLHDG